MYQTELSLQPDEIVQYLRKSRTDDPYLSVEEVLSRHETILREWTERNLSGAIPEEHIFREVVSGETIKDRPEFLRLLRLIESSDIKAILVVEVQRLSRGDLEDAGRLMKILRFTHTLVITPHQIYDLENEYDRDFFERELKRGSEFLEYTKKILNRGRRLSVSQGNYIASAAPYGMNKCWVQEGRRKCPTLEENEKADVVRLIFHKFVHERISPYTIGLYLDHIGEKPPKGKHWTYTSVLEILKNVHYDQKVCWGRRPVEHKIADGKVLEMRPRKKDYLISDGKQPREILKNVHYDQKVCWGRRPVEHKIADGKVLEMRPRKKDYLISDGKQPRIVDHELFLEAQNLLKQTTRTRHGYTPVNPFAGLIFCRSCGYSISFRSYRKKGKEKDACPPRMLCSNQRRCHSSSCSYRELEEAVTAILHCTITEFQIQLSQNSLPAAQNSESTLKTLERRLHELEQKELRQWEKYTDGEMPKEIFDQLNERLQTSRQAVRKALEQARAEMPYSLILSEKRTALFSDALAALQDDSVPVPLKNEYLKAVIERIDYYRPAAVRKPSENSEPKTRGGWYSLPFEMDIKLKL